VRSWRGYFILAGSFLGLFGCGNQAPPATHENVKREQVLPLTLGGFIKDEPEAEKIGGICSTDETRSSLNCDVYNGLPGWTLTELTLAVVWLPHGEDDVRYFQVPIMIKPRTTERIAVRLGRQLPPDEFFKFQG
jgi:hypothetical protein